MTNFDYLLAGAPMPGTAQPNPYTREQKIVMYRLGWYVVPRCLFGGPTVNWDMDSWIKGIDLCNAWRVPAGQQIPSE